MEKIGEKLRAYFEEKGITQEELRHNSAYHSRM